MLSIVLCVICIVSVCLKYVYAHYSSAHPLPPKYSGSLPLIGHSIELFFDELYSVIKNSANDCVRQGGVTCTTVGGQIYYRCQNVGRGFCNHCTDNRFGQWPNRQEPRQTLQEALVRWLDQALDAKSSYPRHGAYCEEVPLSGTLITGSLDPVPDAVISDPQDALTAANGCMQKHFGFDYSKVWMGDGLLTSTGDIWKRHRKLLNPSFTLPVIHSFFNVFNNQAKQLITDFEPYVNKGPFNHLVYLRHNALESLCVSTFGINPIDDKEFTLKYMKSVDKILAMVTARVTKVWLQSDLVYWLCGLKKTEKEIVERLDSMTNEVLQRKKAAMKNGITKDFDCASTGIKYRPFLDRLLELSADGSLSDKEIKEELDTTIAAGFETISNQLTLTLLLLGAHPEVQEKLYTELLEVVGDRDVDKDDVNKLVYTNAVLMECLRLFPSVPLLPRYVDKDVQLKNYTMRAGSQCIIYPLATRRDPAWGDRSDEFRPERWLEDTCRASKEFAAFGLGKRTCIGKTYAIVSMKVTLAHLIRRYKVSADMSNLRFKYKFVMSPVGGHEISIQLRN